MTTAVRFKQSEVQRAIRAARAEGCGAVVIHPDGSIVVKLAQDDVASPATAPSKWEVQEA